MVRQLLALLAPLRAGGEPAGLDSGVRPRPRLSGRRPQSRKAASLVIEDPDEPERREALDAGQARTESLRHLEK